VVVALALVGALSLQTDTWADFPLSRMIGFEGIEPTGTPRARVIPDVLGEQPPVIALESLPEGASLAFEPLILETLPGGFTLTGKRTQSPTSFWLTYQRADGLEIMLSQAPTDSARTTIEREQYELAQVDGIDVLLYPTRAFQSIFSAIWTDDGRLYGLSVLRETASIHLDYETALAIVERVSADGGD
jgi:hypothetical protein